jgi:hypothetical protein
MKKTTNTIYAVEARKQAWMKRLQAEVDRMVPILKSQPGVRRGILYGPLTPQQAGSETPLNLIVIQETVEPGEKRAEEIRQALQPAIELEFLVHTPHEWESLRKTDPFARQVEDEGIVLFGTGA